MDAPAHTDTPTPGCAHARAGLPNGLHHLAIATRDVKAQIEFCTDVLGLELVALYWMHGVADTVHAFLRLSDTASLAFVQGPQMQSIEPQLGVSHAGFTAGPVAPGAVQHVALNVDSEDELLAMRDRIRSRGHFVMGPIDHGMCKSIYFAGPEGLQLELATGSGIDPARWIDPEVVAFCGIEAADLRRYRAPAAFPSQGGAVPQPDPRAKPTFVFPDEMREMAGVLFAASDAEIAAALDHPEPPVPEPAPTASGAGTPGRTLLLALCLLAGSMLATPSHARKPGAAPCEPGAFALSAGEQALLETALGEAPIDRVTLGPDGTVSLGACVAAAKIRPTRKQTVVTARWMSCGIRRRWLAELRPPGRAQARQWTVRVPVRPELDHSAPSRRPLIRRALTP